MSVTETTSTHYDRSERAVQAWSRLLDQLIDEEDHDAVVALWRALIRRADRLGIELPHFEEG